MIRIMFVCLGNICRSPMAEFIMKKLTAELGQGQDFFIASSATSKEEYGNPVYSSARAELARHNIDCSGKVSVQLKKSDYDKYDYFIGMDSANIRNMNRILGSDKDGKIYKLMTFAGKDSDVADPWFSGDFKTAYQDIYEGCQGLIRYLNENQST